jgi:hypothetical protein
VIVPPQVLTFSRAAMTRHSIILNTSIVNPSKWVILNHTCILEDNPLCRLKSSLSFET